MRRSGKEPSRVDLASYFASALNHDTEVGVPEVAPQVCLLPRLKPAVPLTSEWVVVHSHRPFASCSIASGTCMQRPTTHACLQIAIVPGHCMAGRRSTSVAWLSWPRTA